MHRVVLIPGDGIGEEITRETLRVLDAAEAPFVFEQCILPKEGRERGLDKTLVESIRSCGLLLKGPLETPIGKGYRSMNVALRKELDLYANVRPAKFRQGVRGAIPETDLVVIRENTEGLYSGLEYRTADLGRAKRFLLRRILGNGAVPEDGGVTLKVTTRSASLRIAEYAFSYARTHGRRRVTVTHKANIQKVTEGIFLDCAREVAARYPDIEFWDLIVDNAGHRIALRNRPQDFDIILCESAHGDILSDVCAGLVGGLGMTPSAQYGPEAAMFEAVHGTAPDIAGQGIANPTAFLLSSVLLLRHLHYHDRADRIENALNSVLLKGEHLTRDLGGSATTREFTEAVIQEL